MIKKWWFLPLIFMIFCLAVIIVWLFIFGSIGNAILVGGIMLVQTIGCFLAGYNSYKEEKK